MHLSSYIATRHYKNCARSSDKHVSSHRKILGVFPFLDNFLCAFTALLAQIRPLHSRFIQIDFV